MRPDRIHHVTLGRRHIAALGQLAQRLRPEVGGQHDQRLLEVDRAALTIGQHTIVEHLQEHVEDIGMRLFDLIEEHDLIGPTPHRFGQHTALVVTDVARRGTDQTGHGVFLHELRHVDAHHRIVVVKEELGHGLGQLGLAHTGRPEEEEGAQRPVLVVEPRTRPAHGIGHGLHGSVLPDHAVMQLLFHPQQLVALTFEHLARRDACPTLDDGGDLVRAHGLFDHHVILTAFGGFKVAFQLRDHAIR